MRLFRRFMALFIALGFPCVLLAENLGVYGALYSIAEPDLLVGIHSKLQQWENTGELIYQQNRFKQRVKNHSLRPTPVFGVSDLGQQSPSATEYDPTVTLQRDIVGVNGERIARAGAKLNPLTEHPFDDTLIFFNGDNSTQLKWIKTVLNHSNLAHYKLILVQGNVEKTTKSLQHRVYFDQGGVLCHHFGISHTISLVKQVIKNKVRQPRLLIQEIKSV